MAYDRVTLKLNQQDPNGESVSTGIGYVNPAIIESTDTAVVAAGKAALRNLATKLNALTNNTLISVSLTTE